MALEAHLAKLRSKHQQMDTKIQNESKHAAMDEFKINNLKREKMRLKQEITEIEAKIAG